MGIGEDSEDGSIAMDHDLGGCVITRNFEALISVEFFSFRGGGCFQRGAQLSTRFSLVRSAQRVKTTFLGSARARETEI